MIGRSVLHYTIEAELGAGGMGRVYRARDNRTGRLVALKFLGTAQDQDSRARILREGRATARLAHPAIATLYAIEEAGRDLFLVQELVGGESLADRIARNRLTVSETLRMARDVAAALAHAHARGVLHRDLKPSNIMVSEDGSFKLVDFGLSHIEGVTTVTGPGTLTGTVPYMSPERISGEPGDARSDLFALGAVLYESLTGRRAFPGETQRDVMMKILNEDPPALRLPGAGSAAAFAHLITRLMARDPAERPASAEVVSGVIESLMSGATLTVTEPFKPGEATPRTPSRVPLKRYAWVALLVLAAGIAGVIRLRWPAPTPAAGSSQSVAVLYFENVSDPDDREKIGAMAGHLLVTSLAQNPSLDVLSTQTVLDALYRTGSKEDLVDKETAMKVARALKAGRIITGSVLQTRPFIVMTSEVTDVGTGRVVHAARVEGRPGQAVFGVIDELGANLLARLSPGTDQQSLQPVSRQASGDIEAMRLYVQGIESLASGALRQAASSLQAAVARDPAFPQALFNLAIAQWWQWEPAAALSTADKALQVSDRLSPREREFVGGFSEMAAGHYEKARDIFEPLSGRYPDDKMISYGLVECAFHSGDWNGAIQNARRTLEIDPHFTLAATHLVDALCEMSRCAEAEDLARQFLASAPQNEPMWRSLITTLASQGKGEALVASTNAATENGASRAISLMAAAVVIDRGVPLDRIDPRWYQDPDPVEYRDRLMALEYWQALHEGRFRDAGIIADRAWKTIGGRKSIPPLAEGAAPALAMGDEGRMTRLGKQVREILLANPNLSTGVPDALFFPLYCNFRLGRAEEARQELNRLQARPESREPGFLMPANFLRALVLGRGGKTAEALKLLEHSRFMGQPLFRHAMIRWARSRVLLDGRSYAAALAEIDTLLGAPVIDPYDAVLLRYDRGRALEQLGRVEEARSAYKEFLEIWKTADFETSEMREARGALKRLEERS